MRMVWLTWRERMTNGLTTYFFCLFLLFLYYNFIGMDLKQEGVSE